MMKTREFYQDQVEEIYDDQKTSDIQKKDLLVALFDEFIQEEPKKAAPKPKHWPGRYSSKKSECGYYEIWSIDFISSEIAHKKLSLRDTLFWYINLGISCETKKEAKFVKAHLEAKNELIETLKKLNEGWRPDWSSKEFKYEPLYRHSTSEIMITESNHCAVLSDCFQGKSRQAWLAAIDWLGKEKIKLALWPVYEEGK